MSKIYKTTTTTVRKHQRTYWERDGKGGYHPVKKWIDPHPRKVKVRDYTYAIKMLENQHKKEDWSHLSGKYPNTLGLTDEEIEKFIKSNTYEKNEVSKAYIKHMKCFDKDDIRNISKKAYKKFENNMKKMEANNFLKNNPYSKDSTIFITSPRGGFDILSDFGYANKLSKKNFPYDLEKLSYEGTLRAESLPYGYSISDVNDIVFIDDIYMSGEQCHKAYNHLENKINQLGIAKEERPRLHYMAMVGNKHQSHGKYQGWNTFTVGEKYNFRRDGKNFEGVSAVVFPFSIPDGHRHSLARRIYKNKTRFAHRTS
ncbi:MAG: phosphoribosyltransferase-like protein [Candidatus Hodarchaeales archaeon]|jgi:hypothetical protein